MRLAGPASINAGQPSTAAVRRQDANQHRQLQTAASCCEQGHLPAPAGPSPPAGCRGSAPACSAAPRHEAHPNMHECSASLGRAGSSGRGCSGCESVAQPPSPTHRTCKKQRQGLLRLQPSHAYHLLVTKLAVSQSSFSPDLGEAQVHLGPHPRSLGLRRLERLHGCRAGMLRPGDRERHDGWKAFFSKAADSGLRPQCTALRSCSSKQCRALLARLDMLPASPSPALPAAWSPMPHRNSALACSASRTSISPALTSAQVAFNGQQTSLACGAQGQRILHYKLAHVGHCRGGAGQHRAGQCAMCGGSVPGATGNDTGKLHAAWSRRYCCWRQLSNEKLSKQTRTCIRDLLFKLGQPCRVALPHLC